MTVSTWVLSLSPDGPTSSSTSSSPTPPHAGCKTTWGAPPASSRSRRNWPFRCRMPSRTRRFQSVRWSRKGSFPVWCAPVPLIKNLLNFLTLLTKTVYLFFLDLKNYKFQLSNFQFNLRFYVYFLAKQTFCKASSCSFASFLIFSIFILLCFCKLLITSRLSGDCDFLKSQNEVQWGNNTRKTVILKFLLTFNTFHKMKKKVNIIS